MNQYLYLSNGTTIPNVGFGTFKIEGGSVAVESVLHALQSGYRHIDAAAAYNNEESVGKAIALSDIPREQLFITSKVRNSDHGYENTLKAFEKTLADLGLSYLDLYLIHWPKSQNAQTWRALEELYQAGKIKAIGVSNFKEHHLEELMKTATIKPMINQVEFHPCLVQNDLLDYCRKQDIIVEAWSPLMKGKVMELTPIQELANKHQKSCAQITLRWALQKGLVVIPKSTTPSRIKENIDIFNFELSSEECLLIDSLNSNTRTGSDPDVKFYSQD